MSTSNAWEWLAMGAIGIPLLLFFIFLGTFVGAELLRHLRNISKEELP